MQSHIRNELVDLLPYLWTRSTRRLLVCLRRRYFTIRAVRATPRQAFSTPDTYHRTIFTSHCSGFAKFWSLAVSIGASPLYTSLCFGIASQFESCIARHTAPRSERAGEPGSTAQPVSVWMRTLLLACSSTFGASSTELGLLVCRSRKE